MNKANKGRYRSRWLSAATLALTATSILTAMATQVNVFNVTDSEKTIQVRTYYNDVAAACLAAGFSEEYRVIADTGNGQGVRTITVAREFPMNVIADGRAIVVSATEGTVGDILVRSGVQLGTLDEVAPALPTEINEDTHSGTDIAITRVTKECATESVTTPHETTKRNTNDLDFGQTRVLQQGVDGEVSRVVMVTSRDGVSAEREIVSETVISEPITEIIEVGTGGSIVSRGGELLRYSRVLDVKATAYSTEGWSRENKYTKIGSLCRVGAIAVDPKVIPLGSKMYITSPDGESWIYGTAVAEDTGGAIKGNRIDLYYNTQEECERFGVRAAKVYVLA